MAVHEAFDKAQHDGVSQPAPSMTARRGSHALAMRLPDLARSHAETDGFTDAEIRALASALSREARGRALTEADRSMLARYRAREAFLDELVGVPDLGGMPEGQQLIALERRYRRTYHLAREAEHVGGELNMEHSPPEERGDEWRRALLARAETTRRAIGELFARRLGVPSAQELAAERLANHAAAREELTIRSSAEAQCWYLRQLMTDVAQELQPLRRVLAAQDEKIMHTRCGGHALLARERMADRIAFLEEHGIWARTAWQRARALLATQRGQKTGRRVERRIERTLAAHSPTRSARTASAVMRAAG